LLGQPGSPEEKKLYLVDLGLGMSFLLDNLTTLNRCLDMLYTFWYSGWNCNWSTIFLVQLQDGRMLLQVVMLIMTRSLMFSGDYMLTKAVFGSVEDQIVNMVPETP
jgi:hypothetical protein